MNETWQKKSKDDIPLKEALASMNTFREKAGYLWEYYRAYALMIGIGLLVIGGVLSGILHHQTAYFSVEMVNVVRSYYDEKNLGNDLFAEYLKEQGLDPEKTKIEVSDNRDIKMDNQSIEDASTLQILTAEFSSGTFDLFAAPEGVWRYYAPFGAVMDLRMVLPEDWLMAHQDQWYLVTMEETGEEIIGGIYPADDSRFAKAGYYITQVPMGIAIRCKEPEKIAGFIMWAAE